MTSKIFRPGRRLVAGALERWGRIDGLVINAGHPPKGELLALRDDQWRDAFDAMHEGRVVKAVLKP